MHATIIIKCHKRYAISSATVAISKSCFLQVRQLKFYFPKLDRFMKMLLKNSAYITQAPVVQRLDNATHRINHYPADSVVCFVNTYPLDSDLSGG